MFKLKLIIEYNLPKIDIVYLFYKNNILVHDKFSLILRMENITPKLRYIIIFISLEVVYINTG